ncbi:helix-turn-helix transcriptional regulator [Kitasatospora sp. NPDC056731]|uniref:helix-turn-helix domain-containing protein n=1 Tax=Kitasatospora sp. NPDC056731 TaxID=3155422 RepID=UPI003431AB08
MSNGAPFMDAGPAALAAYVRRYAPAAGYDLDAYGEQSRLARAADMGTDVLARILNGGRLPKPAALWPLAEALGRPYLELLVESGTIPAEALAHVPSPPVASKPITADALADQWGVTDEADREYVRDSLERLRALTRRSASGREGGGHAASG